MCRIEMLQDACHVAIAHVRVNGGFRRALEEKCDVVGERVLVWCWDVRGCAGGCAGGVFDVRRCGW